MKRIYLDNASTAHPKAPGVAEAVSNIITNGAFNVSRGNYQSSLKVGGMVYETRELLDSFFCGYGSEYTVFTPSVTYSLNMIIHGTLKKGDHVIITSMEHNAVLRPIAQVRKKGVEVTVVSASPLGTVGAGDIESAVKKNTKAVIMTTASNVCGTLMPIEQVAEICKTHGLLFVLDTAQSAGVLPIDMRSLGVDALCFTAHKGLLALPGLGGILLSERMAELVEPVFTGGTGSYSELDSAPPLYPDRLEAGTLNVVGIAALGHSLKYITEVGQQNIFAHELELTRLMIERVQQRFKADVVEVVGLKSTMGRCAVLPLNFKTVDNSEVAFRLDSEFGVMTRSGLHCAPLAHRSLGTFESGAVRFSFGYNNTAEDVEYAVEALRSIISR